VRQCEFLSHHEEPDDVADHRPDTGIAAKHGRTPERPDDEAGEAEGGDSERNRDDENERYDPGEDVAEREPLTGEDQPEYIADRSHGKDLRSARCVVASGRRNQWLEVIT
jgi:hypothetical protein